MTAFRKPIRLGVIGGIVIVYLASVGMIERFDDRPIITGVLQLSVTLIVITMAGFAYLAGRPEPGASSSAMIRSIVAGTIAGASVGVFGLILELLTAGFGLAVREMFISLSDATASILALGQDPVLGALLVTVLGAVVGAFVGFLHGLDAPLRRVVVFALTAVLVAALAGPLFKVMLDGLNIPNRWLFERDGLTIVGAVVVLVAFGALRWWLNQVGGPRQAVLKLPRTNEKNVNVVITVLALIVLGLLPWIVNDFVSDVLGFVGLYILLGLGLNIVVGYAGLLDLGYVAFYAVGAYSVAILTARSSYLVDGSVTAPAVAGFTNFWIALPITVLIAVLIGVLIGAPVLRLRGDYLAIVTLGFGEIIRTMVLSDWLKPTFGGPQGLTEVASVPFFGLNTRDPQILYYLIFAFAGLAFFIATRLKDSRVGRAWAAMREDEDVAEGMGISVIKYKLLAFAAGAGVGCLGGAFFAAKLSVANPGSFTLLVSINVLAVVVLGGMGSIPGVVVGSLVLVGLPELLREFGEYRLHIYGAILIAIMILKPEGLIPDKRRALELRERHDPTLEEPPLLVAGSGEGGTPVHGAPGGPE
jgi:branched-chain amino acid transport system permease protein